MVNLLLTRRRGFLRKEIRMTDPEIGIAISVDKEEEQQQYKYEVMIYLNPVIMDSLTYQQQKEFEELQRRNEELVSQSFEDDINDNEETKNRLNTYFEQIKEYIFLAEKQYRDVTTTPDQVLRDIQSSIHNFSEADYRKMRLIDEYEIKCIEEALIGINCPLIEYYKELTGSTSEIPDIFLSPIQEKAKQIYVDLQASLERLRRNNKEPPKVLPQYLPTTITAYSNLPTSAALSIIGDVLGSGKALTKLPVRREKYSHSSEQELTVTSNEKRATIEYKKNESKFKVVISNIKALAHNTHQRKIARHIIIKTNQQCLHDNVMYKYVVEFPVSDLVGSDKYLYKNEETAKKQFLKSMIALQAPAIIGEETTPKGKIRQAHTANIFIGSEITPEGMCRVFLNPNLNYSLLFQYITVIPSYYMELPDKSSDLLEYIFVQSRRNGKAIKEGKSFNIGFRSICYYLSLPTEEEVRKEAKYQRHYTQYIFNPLNNAIQGLISRNDPNYSIIVHEADSSNISAYLDNSYLEISIPDFSYYFEPITKAAKRQEEIIQQHEAQEVRREKEAGAAAIQDKAAKLKKKKLK